MNGIKHWKDWLHPIATVLGAWGGFPKPPKIFLELTKFELVRWFLVFILAYQGGAEEDIRQALIITVIFYLSTKLLDLRDVVNEENIKYQEIVAPVITQEQAKQQSAQIQEAQAQAAQDAQAKNEQFYGGYYNTYF